MTTLRAIEQKSPSHAGLVDCIRLMQRELGYIAQHVTDEDWHAVMVSAGALGRFSASISKYAEQISAKREVA